MAALECWNIPPPPPLMTGSCNEITYKLRVLTCTKMNELHVHSNNILKKEKLQQQQKKYEGT